jgi:hypothetical protein
MTGLVVILWLYHCAPNGHCEETEVIPTASYGEVNDPIVVPYDLKSCTANAQRLAYAWLSLNAPTHSLAGYGCRVRKEEKQS